MKALDTLDRHADVIGRYAWWSAWVGLVVGQLHALARHRTEDGKGDLDLPLTRAWAEPAGRALRPLLDWADPDVVYLAYGKIWLPVFLGFFLCALVVAHRRRPTGAEKWAWRVALVGYGWAVVAVAADYWLQWGHGSAALLDATFLATLPGLLLTLVGSSVLGAVLVRRGMRPRASAWLLLGTFPLAILIMTMTSMGSAALPVMFAFGLAGRELARTETIRSNSAMSNFEPLSPPVTERRLG
jgi:hypothetical protein